MYWLTITVTKIINWVIRLLNLGAGFTWPGHVALSLYPKLLNQSSLFPKKGLVFVSATNGKTTTTKLITHILHKEGYSTVTNTSGANLLNGIASALVLHSDFLGKAKADYGIFEVDELALPHLLKVKSPDVLVLLNLSRDQLDRYGETDTILEKWTTAILNMPDSVQMVIDSTQPKLSNLASNYAGKVHFFDNTALSQIQANLNGAFITKNVNAALTTVACFGINSEKALTSLSDFSFAWGRGEKISDKDIDWTVVLAKNPASFNFNLDEIASPNSTLNKITSALIILNDNIPDGRDVSWIYDISPQKLIDVFADRCIYISGTRAYDMAVRLFYAGINVNLKNVDVNLAKIIGNVKKDNASPVLVLPNYSAMLQFRKLVTGRSIL